MEERSLWEANSSSASHEILSICWDPNVHHCTLFKKACQWSLLRIRRICCTPYLPLSSESILSSYLHHISQVAPFLQIFPLKSCMHFNVLPCMPIPYPYHPLLDHPNNVWWAAHIMKLLMIKLYPVFLLLPLKFKYTPGKLVINRTTCFGLNKAIIRHQLKYVREKTFNNRLLNKITEISMLQVNISYSLTK